jgi:hypothetical protein
MEVHFAPNYIRRLINDLEAILKVNDLDTRFPKREGYLRSISRSTSRASKTES